MTAIEFVKNYGWDKAKREVSYIGTIMQMNNSDGILQELKKHTDAYELVQKFGGLANANKILKKAYDSCSSIISDRRINLECSWSDLNKAITLVESVESLKEVT